jgi:preprotein translocase subunit SecB
MADTPNGAAPQQPVQVKMQVLAQYIRDLSFENIVAQKGAGGDVQPDVQVQVGLDAKKRTAENQYEVLSKYTITSKNKETGDILFAMELEYGGIFLIEGVPEAQLHPFLMIECPRMLFPFVRRIVSDMTRDGGFPALNLDTVDFMAIYRNEIERRQKETAAAQPTNA